MIDFVKVRNLPMQTLNLAFGSTALYFCFNSATFRFKTFLDHNNVDYQFLFWK